MNIFENVSKPMIAIMALLLIALAAGAFEEDGRQNPVSDVDGTIILAPTVTAVAPLANTTGVPINTKIITAAFSKAMDPATLTSASFTLACLDGTPVTATVSYLAAGNVATLTLPAATDLPPSTVCTATIITRPQEAAEERKNVDHMLDLDETVIAGVKDATGTPMASNYAWIFTTGVTPDTVHPRVALAVPVTTTAPATPVAAASQIASATTIPGPIIGVPANTAITAVFTTDMRIASR